MNPGHFSAFPVQGFINTSGNLEVYPESGLNKREYFAMQFFAAALGQRTIHPDDRRQVSIYCINAADILIEELSK